MRAGDKVGLVGRNGAGKTSLLRVLGGENRTCRGRGPRPGRPRLPLPGPAHRRGRGSTPPPHPRAVGSRPRRRPPAASRSCAWPVEDPRARRIERYTRAEERFRLDGGYAAESEAHRLADGLGLARPGRTCPLGALLRRRAPPGRAGPHPVRRQRRAAARRADQPPRHRRQELAARLPAPLPRRAARDQPRPRPARRVDHPGAAPRALRRRRHRHLTEYKGTYSQYLAARARRGASSPARSTASRPRSAACPTLADSMRHQTAKAGPHRQVARHAGSPTLADGRGRGSGQAPHASEVRFPEPPPAGRTVLEVDDLARSYGPVDVFDSDVSFDGRARRAPPRHGAQRRGQDLAAADPGRRGRARPRLGALRPPCRPGTTRRSTTSSTRPVVARADARARRPYDGHRAARPARHVRA